MKNARKFLAFLLAMLLVLPTMFACGNTESTDNTPEDTTIAETTVITLNGVSITDYTIVYSESGLDFNKRAAEYISSSIEAITGTAPAVKLDTDSEATANEILVGITNRQDSLGIESVEGKTEGFEFLTVAKDNKILLYGEEYMIASAAYNFVKTLTGTENVTVSNEITVGAPVFEDPKNIIFLIGDGMGFNSLELGNQLYEDNMFPDYENVSGYDQHIVANRLPYKAQSYTHSYDADVTDSAAGGSALATGYKTYNGVVGLDKNLKPVKNLSELAIELGKKTAVLTTDDIYGATPAAFSVHVLDRDDKDDILVAQQSGDIDVFTGVIRYPVSAIRKALDEIDNSENGFFMMYEEAHIDKESHDNKQKTFYTAYTRLNTALRVFLEFVMYNPDTALILTADHETGGITFKEETGKYVYTTGNHTHVNVPFYAIGKGTEFIDGKTFDNTGVSKFAAQLMGVNDFGDPGLDQIVDKTGLEKYSDSELVAKFKELQNAKKVYPGNGKFDK